MLLFLFSKYQFYKRYFEIFPTCTKGKLMKQFSRKEPTIQFSDIKLSQCFPPGWRGDLPGCRGEAEQCDGVRPRGVRGRWLVLRSLVGLLGLLRLRSGDEASELQACRLQVWGGAASHLQTLQGTLHLLLRTTRSRLGQAGGRSDQGRPAGRQRRRRGGREEEGGEGEKTECDGQRESRISGNQRSALAVSVWKVTHDDTLCCRPPAVVTVVSLLNLVLASPVCGSNKNVKMWNIKNIRTLIVIRNSCNSM